MVVRTLIIAMLAVLLFAASAQADTFELVLPATGSYGASSSRNVSVDFGQTFTSIQSISIVWSGSVQGGWQSGTIELAPGPWPGYFDAYLKNDGGSRVLNVGTGGLGYTTYPVAESFGDTRAFQWYSGAPHSWDFLLDGTAAMDIGFSRAVFIGGAGPGVFPTGSLSSVKLVVDATVPEPSCIVTLVTAILGCGLLRRRRA